MIHRLCILFFFFSLSINIYASPAPLSETSIFKNIGAPSRDDIKSAKYLEDFYWAFRNQKVKTMDKSLAVIKSVRKSRVKSFLPILQKGVRLSKKLRSKNISLCEIEIHGSEIEQQFLRLYKKTCLRKESKKILSRSGKLSRTERQFIDKHWKYLSGYRYRAKFIRRLEDLSPTSRIFFSQKLRHYIFNKRALPHKDLLKFLVVDEKLTKFIQSNHLFDQRQQSHYGKEFSAIVKSFKAEYIKGNDEYAEELLEKAIDFYELNKDKISNSKAWTLFITSGKRIARRDNLNMALYLFKISEKTADEEQVHESKFQHLFTLFSEKKLSDARNFIRENQLIENYEKVNSKLRYWIARVFQETKEYKKAKELYLEQIRISPLSFYSILSLKNLRQFTPDYSYSALIKSEVPRFTGLSLKTTIKERLLFYKIFKEAGSSFLSNIQSREIRKISSKDYFRKYEEGDVDELKSYFLIKFFSSYNDHLASFKIAYSGLNKGVISLNTFVIQNLFPNKYRPILKRKSRFLDEKILLSLIRQESAFNEKARSVVGARGLMQIMPATGMQFVKNLRARKLYNPELNISIGAKYLENLLKRYQGNLVFALSAYNAGMGNVSKWQRSIPFNDDVISNIEMIPFKETRNYVKLIYRNLFFYSFLDGATSHLDVPINQSFKVALE